MGEVDMQVQQHLGPASRQQDKTGMWTRRVRMLQWLSIPIFFLKKTVLLWGGVLGQSVTVPLWANALSCDLCVSQIRQNLSIHVAFPQGIPWLPIIPPPPGPDHPTTHIPGFTTPWRPGGRVLATRASTRKICPSWRTQRPRASAAGAKRLC